MGACMYRGSSSKVHASLGAVIEDRGKLRYATGTGHSYYFSEGGVGVQPLVLIGTTEEVLNFIGNKISYSITNTIPLYPEIYMGISKYIPGKRFKGLFPVGDAVVALVEQFTGLVGAGVGGIASGLGPIQPVRLYTDVAGALKDLVDNVKKTIYGHSYSSSEQRKPSEAKGLHYIKFHYWQDKGMNLIGKKKVTFQIIQYLLESMILYKK